MAFAGDILDAAKAYDPRICPKAQQIDSLEHFLKGRDVIVNLPVGFGKSLIYHIIPSLIKKVRHVERPVVQLVVVISPLNIIQKEQINVLAESNIKACKLTYCETGADVLEKEFLPQIIDGQYSIAFAHPEALLNTSTGKDLLSSKEFVAHVHAVIIDECHIVDEWGDTFRTAFQKLKTLPAVLEDTPLMALSGTLTTQKLKRLPEILGMNNPIIIQESPDRSNIFLEKVRKSKNDDVVESYDNFFKEECNSLHKNPSCYPVTLLFMPMFYMSQAAAYLKHLFGTGDISTACYSVLFSKQDKDVMNTTVENLKCEKPRIRLVLTSSVAGMGFDPPSVERVIHAKPPRSLSQYIQEIGRAGRRGQNSVARLHYNSRDIAKHLPGIQADIVEYCKNEDRCLREMLLAPFGFSKPSGLASERCCSFCLSQEVKNLESAGAFLDIDSESQ